MYQYFIHHTYIIHTYPSPSPSITEHSHLPPPSPPCLPGHPHPLLKDALSIPYHPFHTIPYHTIPALPHPLYLLHQSLESRIHSHLSYTTWLFQPLLLSSLHILPTPPTLSLSLLLAFSFFLSFLPFLYIISSSFHFYHFSTIFHFILISFYLLTPLLNSHSFTHSLTHILPLHLSSTLSLTLAFVRIIRIDQNYQNWQNWQNDRNDRNIRIDYCTTFKVTVWQSSSTRQACD